MWSGTVATIPSGWVLCNGSNGTPDLRNRFIVGVHSDSAGVAYTTITGTNTQTGGSKDAIVVSHTHTATVSDPGHAHKMRYTDISNQQRDTPNLNDSAQGWDLTGFDGLNTSTVSTGISVSISTEGASGTNANLPPYYALAFIMKT